MSLLNRICSRVLQLGLVLGVSVPVALSQSATIKGSVRSQRGQPLWGSNVKVVVIDHVTKRVIDRQTVILTSGEFESSFVQAGSYDIVACAGSDYIPNKLTIELKDGKVRPTPELILTWADDNVGGVSGSLRNGKGVKLTAFADECEVASVTAGESGEYVFPKLPASPPDYQIAAETSKRLLKALKRVRVVSKQITEVSLSFLGKEGSETELRAEVSAKGELTGRVVDPNGAAVGGVSVHAINPMTGTTYDTTTNEAGGYSLEVPPGKYRVVLDKPGFKTYREDNVLIAANQASNVEVNLSVGSLGETVTVSAEGPLIDITKSSIATSINERTIQELPVLGRDFASFTLVSPGVQRATDSKRPGAYGISMNGSRAESNNYILDGADVDNADSTASISREQDPELPFGTIAKQTTSSHDRAEVGHQSGGTIAVETKHGTDNVHGSGFYWNRNSALAARDFFEIDKSHFLTHQFGFTIGGPVEKDRLFYFGGYEGKRELDARPRLVSVPSPARLASARSILSANGLIGDPLSTRLLQFFTSPDRPSVFSNRTLNSPAVNDSDNFLVRIDRKFKSSSLTVAYSFARTGQLFPLAPSFLPGFRTNFSRRTQSLSGTFNTTFTPRLINEFWFRYDRNSETFFPEDHDFDPISIGLNTGVTSPKQFGLPSIKVVGFDVLGSPVDLSNQQLATTWQIKDIFTVIRGMHTMRFGGDFRRAVLNARNDAGTRGRIAFDGSVLGDPLADFLGGFPTGNTAILRGDTQRTTAITFLNWFVQEEIRPKPNLTLNLGLRYGFNGAPEEERNQLSSFRPEAGGLVQVGSTQPLKLYKSDLNNFAPRIGIVWDPTRSGNLAIRANWGIFFNSPSLRLFTSLCPCPNSVNPGVTMNPIGSHPVFALSPSRPIPFGTGIPVFQGPGLVDLSVVEQNLKNPYVQNFYLGLQYTLISNTVLEVDYSGSAGTHLYRLVDINQPTPGDPGTRDTRRPFFLRFPQFGSINVLTSSGKSNYHAFRISVQRRLSNRLWFIGGYDFSKAIDEASDASELPQDSRNLRAERALSRFDQRHRFILSWLYEFKHSKHELFNGWEVSGVFKAESGNPFTPLISFDNSGTATFLDRPNLTGDPRVHQSRTQLYTSTAFGFPPKGAFGNAGRNSLVGPGLNSWDVSVIKRTYIGQDRYIELRSEIYDLFNHPNFRLPNNSVDDPAFGTVTATDIHNGRRRIQIGIRMEF